MANTTIKVKSLVTSNGWFNIKTEDGKDVSVLADKNPKLKAQLEAMPHGGTLDLNCSLVEKNGKNYAWDPKEGNTGGGGFMKKGSSATDESFCASYAKDIWVAKIQAKESFDINECLKVADRLFDWMKSKKQPA